MSDSSAFALFLDFDGTLVDIAPRPDAVVVEPGLVETLERLRDRFGGALALVSGRPIATLDDFLTPARFDAAGLHGVERRIGGALSGGGADDHPDLRARIGRLKQGLAELQGIIVEDKGASVSVHWRLADAADARAAQAVVTAIAAELGAAYKLLLGKSVGEILPADATKGHAIRAFCEQAPYAGRRAIFLGDDRTDELAFESINADGGISVRVGDGETVAGRRLASPRAVRALLASWAGGAPLALDGLPAA